MSSVNSQMESLLAPCLKDAGYSIVSLSYNDRGLHLHVVIERLDEEPITLDDCTKATNAILVELESNDPIDSNYMIEVSSPGLERPLIKFEDFVRFKGQRASVELSEAIEGKRRFKAFIIEASEGIINFRIDTSSPKGTKKDKIKETSQELEMLEVPFGTIRKAKLALSDDFFGNKVLN